jgi:hypothetical protein
LKHQPPALTQRGKFLHLNFLFSLFAPAQKALLFMYFLETRVMRIFFLSSEEGILLHEVESRKNGGRAATAEAKADPH